MSNSKAQQLVNTLLEYGQNPGMPPVGGEEDPWRQTKGPLSPLTFKSRPGSTDKEVVDPPHDPELDASTEIPIKKKTPPTSRFQWRPPANEDLLHEYGGHPCPKCQKLCAGNWDKKTGKLCCAKCGSALDYPKSASLRSKEAKKD